MTKLLNPNRNSVDANHIDKISEHFSSVTKSELEIELCQVKHVKKQYSTQSVKTFSGVLVASYVKQFPILCKLAEIYLDLNMSTAEVERMFSQMNCTMTKLRNSMKVENMNRKIFIKMIFKLLSKDMVNHLLLKATRRFCDAKNIKSGLGQIQD